MNTDLHSTDRKRVDLSRFNNADFPKGAGGLKMTLWYFTNALFFLNPLFPFRSVKPGLLRLFGAQVGQGVVMLGVTLKSHSVLSAGSVATKDLEPYMIYQGNPAQPIRERVIE